MELRPGKAPLELLEAIVFKKLGRPDPDVLVGPAYGEDAGVVRLPGGLVLAAHCDPITAASRYAGWLAVNVAANDVAVRGVRPRWLLVLLLLPAGGRVELLEDLASQAGEAADSIGATIIGGHTEAAPGLRQPLIAVAALGVGRGFIRTSGARPGDVIIMTKTAAVEGTAILATDYASELERRGVPRGLIERASRFIRRVSVVREALTLAERGLADSMHDPTEGGVLGGVAEMAYASNVTITVYENRIPVAPETRALARAAGLDPLRLISSGSLLAAVPRGMASRALEALAAEGVEASIIGEVEDASGEPGAVLVRSDGSRVILPRQVEDEIYRVAEAWGLGGG